MASSLALIFALGLGADVAGQEAAKSPKGQPQPKVLDAVLQTLEGKAERLSERRGKRLLLDLWATWCLPCQEQSEIVHSLAPELENLGIEVLAINIGQGPHIVRDYLSRTPSHHAVLLDRRQQIPRQLSLSGLPALVLLDENGKVLGLRTGLTLKKDLETWLGEAFGEG